MNPKASLNLNLLLMCLGLIASGCTSTPSEPTDADSGTVGSAAVSPAQIGPDECVNYVQEKRDSDFVCELADGTTRPLKQGERRSNPLSRDEIARVVARNSEDTEMCLQAARQSDPKADGKTYIHFEIGAEGRVAKAEYLKERSTYKNETLGKCLADKVKAWRFPVLRSDETLEINYPFVLVNPELNSSQAEQPAAPADAKKPSAGKQSAPTHPAKPSSKKK
ncbi:MAG: hypothetical protein RIR26_1343 [Pseudomonadota bacterium]|jgi:hypothetical protein